MKTALVLTLLAASGDRILVRRSPELFPNAGQRVSLMSCITDVDAGVTNLQRVEGFKREASGVGRFRITDQRTSVAATFQNREDGGRVESVVSVDGSGNVTYNHRSDWVRLTAPQWTCFANWADALVGVVTAANFRKIEAWRSPDDNTVRVYLYYETRLSPTNYVQVPREDVYQIVGTE